jgi:peptide deformylase
MCANVIHGIYCSREDPIVQIEAPVLREIAQEVPKKELDSRKIKALITKMKKALGAEEYGVAIAAPQVGRLFAHVCSRRQSLPRRR